MERSFGTFCRRFKLPDSTDPVGITATCDHGVLTVVVPKKDEPRKQEQEIMVLSGDEEGDGSLNKEFEQVPISIFPTPSLGQMVEIPSDMSILDAVKTLSRHHILAAPVRDVKQPDDAGWTDKYIGTVDMVGIVFHMLETLKPSQPADFAAEIETVDAFKKATVADAVNFPRFGPFIPIDVDRGNLLDAMLLCGNHNIRRVMVVKSPGGGLLNIITQSALVQTLHANLERFSNVASKTLAELGFGSPEKVYTVRRDRPLMEAFTIIKERNISAIPVVDEAGVIKGNISARDVRLIATSAKIYKLLHMPISVYLDVVSEGVENSAITCRSEHTLAEMVSTLVENRIHRVYMVDKAGRPIRVISLRNIIRKFVKEPEGYFGHYFG